MYILLIFVCSRCDWFFLSKYSSFKENYIHFEEFYGLALEIGSRREKLTYNIMNCIPLINEFIIF